MTIVPHVDLTPDAMTTRARVVLIIVAVHNAAIGVAALTSPRLFSSVAFHDVDQFGFGLIGWGVLLAGVAVVAAVAAVTRDADWARAGLGASAVTTSMIAAGVSYSWVTAYGTETPFSPAIPISLGSLVALELVMIAQPIRTPLESMVRRSRRAT